MRILLTGASGFVGRAAIRTWTAQGHQVQAVTRNGGSDTVEWDFTRSEAPQSPVGPFDAIVHMAQSRRYRDFPADAAEMFAVNVASTQRLLDFGASRGVRQFCLISTGNVYEPYDNLDEAAPLSPTGYLGASKLAAEILTRGFEAQFSIRILRLFQPYGPGQTGRLIPELIRRVREGSPISVGADGQGMCVCPTYVDDVTAVIADALTQDWRGVFNVASPEAMTIRQMGAAIGSALGIKAQFAVDDSPSLRVVPKLDRLAARTDLTRFRPFSDGIAQVIGESAAQLSSAP